MQVRDESGQFTQEFMESEVITGDIAKDIALAELEQRVLKAASTNAAVSSAMNSLLVGALEMKVDSDDPENALNVKERSSDLLSLASTLESVVSSISTEDPNDPKYEANVEFYDRAQVMQDQLQADYVGMSLEDWQDIAQLPDAETVRSDRINAVTVNKSYDEWVALRGRYGTESIDAEGKPQFEYNANLQS